MIEIRHSGHAAILTPHHPITTGHLEELGAGIVTSQRQGITTLIIDMSEVTHLDSKGLEALQDWAIELTEKRFSLRLANPNSVCADVLCATRIESVVDVFATTEDAIRAGR